jgi:hypothetical protein
MQSEGTVQRGYPSDDFLDRVRRAYQSAIATTRAVGGMWHDIDARRADVHAALLADGTDALRAIFIDPVSTDLYYGVDNLCRSIAPTIEPSSFVAHALDSERAKLAVYQVRRLQELAGPRCTVIEIGPGMGRAAFYGHHAGLDYTTVDLPLGVVAQACFLGVTLGPEALWFEGEDPSNRSGRIKILAGLPESDFEIALNVDSLTEIPVTVALDYMRSLAPHAGLFLSINHENNFFTAGEAAVYSGNWRRKSRRACPVWSGYVEEVFSPCGSILPVVVWRHLLLNLVRMHIRLRKR